MSYTEEVLDKSNKREPISMMLPFHSKDTKKSDLILKEIRQWNRKFSQLESENVVVKQANSLLPKCLVDTERQC